MKFMRWSESVCRVSVLVQCIVTDILERPEGLELGGDLKRFDWDPSKHYHIRCLECGRVDDAPIAPLRKIEDELYGATVYTIIGHRLVFEGLCPQCTKKAAENQTDLQGLE